MNNKKSRKTRQEFLSYLFHHYFRGDFGHFTEVTDYSATQVKSWLSGRKAPRQNTLDYILQCKFAPEFQIVCEFKEIDGEKPTMTQLRAFLGKHGEESGIYAFYDSRAQLLYVGKATKLLQEVYAALMHRADLVVFPSGIKNKEKNRWELVTYFSAYSVPTASHRDHPKHVESLILRISKPPLNKQIGLLSKAPKPRTE
jgi:hypothetical protein